MTQLQDQPLETLAEELQRRGHAQYHRAFSDHSGDLFVADLALKAGKQLHLAAAAIRTAEKAQQKYWKATPTQPPGPEVPRPPLGPEFKPDNQPAAAAPEKPAAASAPERPAAATPAQ